MDAQERRKFRRARLRLSVVAKEGAWPEGLDEGLWTKDVSAGGMYLHLPTAEGLELGQQLTFQVRVQPGSGHAAQAATVRGVGCVVRTETAESAQAGVALQFTRPLLLEL